MQNPKKRFWGPDSVCPRRGPGYWCDNTSIKSAIKHFCLTENIVVFPSLQIPGEKQMQVKIKTMLFI